MGLGLSKCFLITVYYGGRVITCYQNWNERAYKAPEYRDNIIYYKFLNKLNLR